MKSYVYTIEDDWQGIPLIIEGELVDWEDKTPPDIIINDISYDETPLAMWTFSERFIDHLKDRIFQTWCQEK